MWIQPHIRIWNSISLVTLKVIGIGDFFDRAVSCLAFSKMVRVELPLLSGHLCGDLVIFYSDFLLGSKGKDFLVSGLLNCFVCTSANVLQKPRTMPLRTNIDVLLRGMKLYPFSEQLLYIIWTFFAIPWPSLRNLTWSSTINISCCFNAILILLLPWLTLQFICLTLSDLCLALTSLSLLYLTLTGFYLTVLLCSTFPTYPGYALPFLPCLALS